MVDFFGVGLLRVWLVVLLIGCSVGLEGLAIDEGVAPAERPVADVKALEDEWQQMEELEAKNTKAIQGQLQEAFTSLKRELKASNAVPKELVTLLVLNTSGRAHNTFTYNRGSFHMGVGLFEALQTREARLFMMVNALTWQAMNGMNKAHSTAVTAKIGGFVTLATLGAASPVLLYTGGRALIGYPHFIYSVDKRTVETLATLKVDLPEAVKVFNVLKRVRAFTFVDQDPREYQAGWVANKVVDPNQWVKTPFRVPSYTRRYNALARRLKAKP
jgi:hypothetical protein